MKPWICDLRQVLLFERYVFANASLAATSAGVSVGFSLSSRKKMFQLCDCGTS